MSETMPFTWIPTHSGIPFVFRAPTAAMIVAEDIAHALSNICRFGGHCKRHYSVAEHSRLVAAMVSPVNKKQAMLHDATEAYLGDIVSPLKHIMMGDYARLEDKCREAICERFDMDFDIPKEVKDADSHALYLEAKYLSTRTLGDPNWWEYFKIPRLEAFEYRIPDHEPPRKLLKEAFLRELAGE